MEKVDWRERVIPTLMVAGVISLVLSLIVGGFIVYQWVLAFEATAASIAILVYYLIHLRSDKLKSRWPPLLPMSIIGLSGGAKSFYVATGADTPLLVVVILFIGVAWFVVGSLKVMNANRRLRTKSQ